MSESKYLLHIPKKNKLFCLLENLISEPLLPTYTFLVFFLLYSDEFTMGIII